MLEVRFVVCETFIFTTFILQKNICFNIVYVQLNVILLDLQYFYLKIVVYFKIISPTKSYLRVDISLRNFHKNLFCIKNKSEGKSLKVLRKQFGVVVVFTKQFVKNTIYLHSFLTFNMLRVFLPFTNSIYFDSVTFERQQLF